MLDEYPEVLTIEEVRQVLRNLGKKQLVLSYELVGGLRHKLHIVDHLIQQTAGLIRHSLTDTF